MDKNLEFLNSHIIFDASDEGYKYRYPNRDCSLK